MFLQYVVELQIRRIQKQNVCLRFFEKHSSSVFQSKKGLEVLTLKFQEDVVANIFRSGKYILCLRFKNERFSPNESCKRFRT